MHTRPNFGGGGVRCDPLQDEPLDWPSPHRPGINPPPVKGHTTLPAQGIPAGEDDITYSQRRQLPVQGNGSADNINYSAGQPGAHRRRAQRAQRSTGMRLYFANVTSWSRKAEEYLTTSPTIQASHVVAFAEHHKRGAGLVQMVKRLRKSGWRTTAVEAAHTGTAQVREGQGHGGVMVATREHLHQRGLTADGKANVQKEEHTGLVTQWTARVVRARGRDVLFVVIYLAPGLGLEDTNLITLQEAGAYIRSMGLEFILTGDFNMTTDELDPLAMDTFLGGVWRRPDGEVPGGHRAIDLALISSSLAMGATLRWDGDGPWAAPHSGMIITLDLTVMDQWIRRVVAPPNLSDQGHAAGPDRPWAYYQEYSATLREEGDKRLRAYCKAREGQDPSDVSDAHHHLHVRRHNPLPERDARNHPQQGFNHLYVRTCDHLPAVEAHDHLRHASPAHRDAAVDRLYVDFAVAAERLLLDRCGGTQTDPRTHRGWPVTTELKPLCPRTPEGWMAQPTGLAQWAALAARLQDSLHAAKKGRVQLTEHHWEQVQRHCRTVESLPRILEDVSSELAVLEDVRKCNLLQGGAETLVKLKAFFVRKLEGHLLRRSHRRFKDWVSKSLKTGAGALHRYTRTFGEPAAQLAEVRGADGQLITGVLEQTDHKAAQWRELWQASQTPLPAAPWWRELRRKLELQERHPVEVEDLRAALRCFKTKVGMGPDQQNPRWWLGLPEEAHAQLAAVLEEVEAKVTWPTPTLETVVQLLPKTTIADRPITLTQGLYRVWGRLSRN